MANRWRDKKGELGFAWHTWMGTVDELEDEIDRLRGALKEISTYPLAWEPAHEMREIALDALKVDDA